MTWLGMSVSGAMIGMEVTVPARKSIQLALQRGTMRVRRGGLWALSAFNCREPMRDAGGPDERYFFYGFRVVLPSRGAASMMWVGPCVWRSAKSFLAANPVDR